MPSRMGQSFRHFRSYWILVLAEKRWDFGSVSNSAACTRSRTSQDSGRQPIGEIYGSGDGTRKPLNGCPSPGRCRDRLVFDQANKKANTTD
jgi:hypothetical protein